MEVVSFLWGNCKRKKRKIRTHLTRKWYYTRFGLDQLIYNLIKVISLLNEAMLLDKDQKMERLAKVCSVE